MLLAVVVVAILQPLHTVEFEVQPDHSVWSRLTVSQPDSSSSGTYQAIAENAGGTTTLDFTYMHTQHEQQHTAAIIVGVVGMVVIFLLGVGGWVLWRRRRGQAPYRELRETATGEETGQLQKGQPASYGTGGQPSMVSAAQPQDNNTDPRA